MVTPPPAKPLAGIRVLDLTRFVSGAYCTMVLDALGADVIKVEGLPGGDPYRAQGAVHVGSLSGLFASLNTGKRSIAVDLRAADGTGLVRTLAQASDVFVENARPGSLERAGLGPDRLHALNPRLVYASISGFGQAGPDAARGGFDLILQAASGIMAVTGNEAGGPVKVGAPVLDIGAGMSAATAIMAALFARTADGLGRTVSSSLLEFALSCFTSYAADILETGTSPGLLGNDSPQFAPYGVFRCRDGSLALAGAGSEPLWLKLCDVLGRPDWAADPRFATNADRLRHRAELTDEIERVLTRETAAHWQQALDGAGIPASPVLPPAAALTSAQAEALQIRQAARTPDGYGYQTVRPPLSVASCPDEPAGPGPASSGPSTDSPSTAGPGPAGPGPASSGPSTDSPSTAGPGPAGPGPASSGPSTDSPSTAGPGPAGPGPASSGPSTDSPSTAGPGPAGPGPASSGPSTDSPSTAGPGPASPGPASSGPSTDSPSTAGPGPASPGPASSGPSTDSPSTAGPGPASPGPASSGPSTDSPSTAGPGPASPGPAGPGPASSGPSTDGTLGYSRGAPALGEHTAEILREAGLDPAHITDLAARGIVAG